MRITNIEIHEEGSKSKIILLLDGQYQLVINRLTGEAVFDEEFEMQLDLEFDDEDIQQLQEDPHGFFLHHDMLFNPDFGGEGLALEIRGAAEKIYNKLALKYNCYLGQCWNGNDYDYLLFLQMDYEQ